MTESVHMAFLSLLEFAPASVTNIRHRLFEAYGLDWGYVWFILGLRNWKKPGL